jgi:hypothetical protein
VPGGITGPPCQWGTCIKGPDPPGWGFDTRLTTLVCENIVAKSKQVKTGCNLAESLRLWFKRAVLPIMINDNDDDDDDDS